MAAFLIAPTLVAGLLLTYNLHYFGNALGGYAATQPASHLALPSTERLLGLLVSPSRGLLVCSPVLILSLVGMGRALGRRRDALLVYTAVATLLTIFFYSCWPYWHGHFSYSYRHLVRSNKP